MRAIHFIVLQLCLFDDDDAQCTAEQYLLDEGNTFYCLATFVFLSAWPGDDDDDDDDDDDSNDNDDDQNNISLLRAIHFIVLQLCLFLSAPRLLVGRDPGVRFNRQ